MGASAAATTSELKWKVWGTETLEMLGVGSVHRRVRPETSPRASRRPPQLILTPINWLLRLRGRNYPPRCIPRELELLRIPSHQIDVRSLPTPPLLPTAILTLPCRCTVKLSCTSAIALRSGMFPAWTLADTLLAFDWTVRMRLRELHLQPAP